MYGPEVMTVYHYYWENRLAEFRNMDADMDFTLENLAADRLILSDLETCTRAFHRWHEATGAGTFLLHLRQALLERTRHDKITQAIRLFGDRVLPYCN